MNTNNIALIVIYNHRFDENIDRIEKLYSGRFSNIYHLIPFYDGTKENVIPVYGRSVFFESYVAQGFNSFYNSRYTHYFFVADDMIINPAISEISLKSFFRLNDTQSYISSLIPLHTLKKIWIGGLSAFFYIKRQKYVETTNELPKEEESMLRFYKQGINIEKMTRKNIFGSFSLKINSLGKKAGFILRLYTYIRYPFRRKIKLPYPMVGSYSDIFIVSSDTIKDFCHYCGVFGVTGLFAEVAIPTAMVLATKDKIVTEDFLEHKGRSFWQGKDALFWESDISDVRNLDKMFKSLDDILSNFPSDCIYLHPVKLSKWSKKTKI
jgi:hypothetical protein